jgi:hypothetical protein
VAPDPRRYTDAVHGFLIAPAAALALAWLWFLARGKAQGSVKRVMLRATLAAVVFGLVTAGARRGLFARATMGFKVALLLALLTVAFGYLYLIRFCGSCGRMERNIKLARCKRCGGFLPVNGMSGRLRREGDELRWDERLRQRRTR